MFEEHCSKCRDILVLSAEQILKSNKFDICCYCYEQDLLKSEQKEKEVSKEEDNNVRIT